MNKLRTGDEVIVISGKDKGKTGTITKFLANDKCEISGIKIVKKHQKPNPQANIQGGIIEKESPIHTPISAPTKFSPCVAITGIKDLTLAC